MSIFKRIGNFKFEIISFFILCILLKRLLHYDNWLSFAIVYMLSWIAGYIVSKLYDKFTTKQKIVTNIILCTIVFVLSMVILQIFFNFIEWKYFLLNITLTFSASVFINTRF